MKDRTIADNAVIWAYHSYNDNKVLEYFDTFMNLSAMYGMYRVTRFTFSSVWNMLGRFWRKLTTSRNAMFNRYSKLCAVTRIDNMRIEEKRIPF